MKPTNLQNAFAKTEVVMIENLIIYILCFFMGLFFGAVNNNKKSVIDSANQIGKLILAWFFLQSLFYFFEDRNISFLKSQVLALDVREYFREGINYRDQKFVVVLAFVIILISENIFNIIRSRGNKGTT